MLMRRCYISMNSFFYLLFFLSLTFIQKSYSIEFNPDYFLWNKWITFKQSDGQDLRLYYCHPKNKKCPSLMTYKVSREGSKSDTYSMPYPTNIRTLRASTWHPVNREKKPKVDTLMSIIVVAQSILRTLSPQLETGVWSSEQDPVSSFLATNTLYVPEKQQLKLFSLQDEANIYSEILCGIKTTITFCETYSPHNYTISLAFDFTGENGPETQTITHHSEPCHMLPLITFALISGEYLTDAAPVIPQTPWQQSERRTHSAHRFDLDNLKDDSTSCCGCFPFGKR